MKKLGQLFITGVRGLVLQDDEKDFIEKEDIGGVILFSRNYESPGQLAELINSIQMLRDEYPLFISVDQEGGRVQRFKGLTQVPATLKIAARNSPKAVFEIYSMMARELMACGFNLNFAPVCDVLINEKNTVIGDRSFGRTSGDVCKFISGAIRGLQTNGIIACAKHFPGHGSTTKDSHHELPIVKTPLEKILQEEIPSFNKASKSRVEMMMMAHLVVDALDEERPTSLSPAAYRFLRESCRFKKIIVTDDLDMQAIAAGYDLGEASVMALSAGADLLCFRSFESAMVSFEAVKKAFVDHQLSGQDINEKFERVLACKRAYLKEYRPVYIPDLRTRINTAEHQRLVSQLS